MTPIDSLAYQAAAKAIETTFNKKTCSRTRWRQYSHLHYLERELGVKIVFMGFGLTATTCIRPMRSLTWSISIAGHRNDPLFPPVFCGIQ